MVAIILREKQISDCRTVDTPGHLTGFLQDCYFSQKFLNPFNSLPLLQTDLREELAKANYTK